MYNLRVPRSYTLAAVCVTAITLAVFFFQFPSGSNAQLSKLLMAGTLSGRVFVDYNSNGTFDTAAGLNSVDTGVANVTVTAFDPAGAMSGSAVTNSAGTYTISATGTGPYRLEFTNIPTGYFPSSRSTDSVSGGSGTDAGSSVQFVANGNTSNINFAINRPEEYCENNPQIAGVRSVGGAQNGVYSGNVLLYSFPYNSGTAYTDTTVANYDAPAMQSLSTAVQVGTIFSLAYNRSTNWIYASAFFKKHAGFGPGADLIFDNADDPAAIYVINRSTGNVASAFTVPNATTNSHDTSDYSTDNGNVAWDAVGKTSLGGMDLADDGSRLFVMNLQDRRLYALDPLTGANLGSSASITTLTLPTPGGTAANCSTGSGNTNKRPFAVNYYRGQVYIGVVCTAETNGNAANLFAYVFQVDPTTLAISATPTFSTPLNYTRGLADPGWAAEWQAWRTTATANFAAPQPILSSIEFENGNLILGLRDRAGDQAYDNGTNAKRTAGDIVRACGTFGSWSMESNGRCGGNGTAPQNTGQGFGNGEFYHQDDFCSAPNNGNYHDEISWSALLYIPGRRHVVSTVLDPINRTIFSGGIFDGGLRYFNNTTGSTDRAYRIYDGSGNPNVPDFGKANGLGAMTSLCSAAPIEIGNRVWRDSNGNGVQDPGENGIAGVSVRLYSGSTPMGTAVTDANGEYYFVSSATEDTNTGDNSGQVNGGIQPGTNYQIRFDVAANYGAGGPLLGLGATTSNQTSQAGSDDASDSDAASTLNPPGSPAGVFPVISLTTGSAGSNDHTLDVGFTSVITAANSSVSGRVRTSGGAGIRNVLVTLIEENGNMHTSVSGTFGYYRFDNVEAGQAVVVSVSAKKYIFPKPVRLISVKDDVAEVDFISSN